MPNTQLACPHCGSTLSFGSAIAAGTSVECLICMRAFAAQPIMVEAPASTPEIAKPAMGIAEKSPPVGKPEKASPARPAPARGHRSEEASGGGSKFGLIAVAACLVLILSVGLGVTIWKIATANQTDVVEKFEEPFASNNNTDPIDEPAKKEIQLIPKKADDSAKKPAANPPEKKDDDTPIPPNEEKKVLVRKKPIQPIGEDFKWEPVLKVKDLTDAYVGLNQEKINRAIEKGIQYLKQHQDARGTWSGAYSMGHAALGGLTLLECGVPANDASVQRAAQHVRGVAAGQDQTYELSLAVLFLDRLGEPRDRPLIQGMALRLLAGQGDCGGWNYTCPKLTPHDMYQLLAFLQSNKQFNQFNPLQGDDKKPVKLDTSITRDNGRRDDPFGQFNDILVAKGLTGTAGGEKNPAVKPKTATPIRPEWLTPNLRNLYVVQNQGKGKGRHRVEFNGAGDNSNTQFALLALWAARRHDVPNEQAVLASCQRFVTSQNKDGGWLYAPSTNDHASSDTMTCVGLLGLAMGHGVAPDIIKLDPKNPKDAIVRPALDDPRIQRGLKTLSQHINQPVKKGKFNAAGGENHYFLWSVERVAVLYDLKTINGKEWYPWGAQLLVHRQDQDGHWGGGGYPGACPPVNTCFALLFLKRSNLVQDLTTNLRLYSGIRDPEK